MKIVVYRVSNDSWRWDIRDGDKPDNRVAVGLKWYTRKSDAKRGATRFESKLYKAYMNAQDPQIYIEVVD